MEPEYPYVVEKYLDLGVFCKSELLTGDARKEIKSLLYEYRCRYAGVYRCIKASRFVGDDLFGTVFSPDVIGKVRKRARGIIKREIHPSRRTAAGNSPGREIKRFLSALSHKGNVFLEDTVTGLCSRIYEINDTYGLSHFMLSAVRDAAVSSGHDVFACFCSINPENKLDHLIIPGLSLAFVSVHRNFGSMKSPYRRIHLDAYLDRDTLKNNRQRLKFMRRTCASLLAEAVDGLRAAKAVHDRIEALYRPCVDFDGLYDYARKLGGKLIERYRE